MSFTIPKELRRYFGWGEITKKPQIETPPHFPKPYPWRHYALGLGGKSKSLMGVAGWRNNYHRPGTPLPETKKYTCVYSPMGELLEIKEVK